MIKIKRRRDILTKLKDISILLQYLYMDSQHSVTFNNGLANLKIQMDENLNIKCKNLNFPDLPAVDWSEDMTPRNCCNIIETLKETPSVEFPKYFKNRWDEIKTITEINLSLNLK